MPCCLRTVPDATSLIADERVETVLQGFDPGAHRVTDSWLLDGLDDVVVDLVELAARSRDDEVVAVDPQPPRQDQVGELGADSPQPSSSVLMAQPAVVERVVGDQEEVDGERLPTATGPFLRALCAVTDNRVPGAVSPGAQSGARDARSRPAVQRAALGTRARCASSTTRPMMS